MALGDAQNGERLLFPKNSFKTKSHSYSWTEDEINKNVSEFQYSLQFMQREKCECSFVFKQSFNWSKERIDETRKQSDKVRDLCSLAEKLGCSPTQLSWVPTIAIPLSSFQRTNRSIVCSFIRIAWTLKHEPVQCLLVGATTVEQLHQNLQALQVRLFLERFHSDEWR